MQQRNPIFTLYSQFTASLFQHDPLIGGQIGQQWGFISWYETPGSRVKGTESTAGNGLYFLGTDRYYTAPFNFITMYKKDMTKIDDFLFPQTQTCFTMDMERVKTMFMEKGSTWYFVKIRYYQRRMTCSFCFKHSSIQSCKSLWFFSKSRNKTS